MPHECPKQTRLQRALEAGSSFMRVMFDSQIFCHQRFGGISRYFVSIVRAMAANRQVSPLVVAPFHFNEYLETLPATLVSGRRIRWLEGFTALAFGASVLPSRFTAQKFRPEIIHSTFYYPGGHVGRARRILTIHDMIHERYPDGAPANRMIARWKAQCARSADHIICISENTKRDVIDTYGVSEERLSVTHLSCDDLADRVGAETEHSFKIRMFGMRGAYLLFVGGRQGYKNFTGLLRAYAASPWLRDNFRLVCFGGGTFSKSEQSEMSDLGIAEEVIQCAGNDQDLAGCYRHAAVFVYPSLYEGFGIPPLEAMSVGCPVVCGNNSSLPEVVGDAAAMFDAASSESIRATLEELLASPAAIDALVRRGTLRRRQFSWQRCASETVGIYHRVLDAG